MVARIQVYDGKCKIIDKVQRVREVPTISDEGLEYTDCYIRLDFSIVDNQPILGNTLADKIQENFIKIFGRDSNENG